MSADITPLTARAIMATATDVLLKGGYRQVRDDPEREAWVSETARLFEDPYNLVGIVVYETLIDLLHSWTDLQADLVTVMSRKIGLQEAKAWDGYLVLLTPGVAADEFERLDAIRYNTNRVRKIVATGEEVRTAANIQQVLSGLLPLTYLAVVSEQGSALDALPGLLEAKEIPRDATEAVVDAFRKHAPLLDPLFRRGAK